MIVKSEDDIIISQVLVQMLGFKEALFLKVLDMASDKSTTDVFKCPYSHIEKDYGLTRHTQANILKTLEKHSIVATWDGDTPKEGRNFKIDKNLLADLNLIIISVTSKDLVKFQFRTKNFVKKKLDIGRIKTIVSKF
tara:strand:- start:95 stop:505 length:411 start_codon:yes stop_codon:yes gene_type:complete